jgi:5-methylcytosine-specific restriction endonuclease McrA
MTHPAYRGRRWIEVRLAVLLRDRWTCQLCGGLISAHLPPGSHDDAGTADHIIPIAHGGRWWAMDNLRAAHVRCNRKRGAKTGTAVKYPAPRAW